MLVLPLSAVLLVWYLIIVWKWKKNVFDVVEKIPGLKWYPLFGTFFVFQGVSREYILYKFVEVTAKFGSFYRSWNGTAVPEVHLTKPEHIQMILKSSTHNVKGSFYKLLYPWLGDGLFISEGLKWFLQRKMLTPKFHFKILESFIGTFAEKSAHLTEALDSKANGEHFDISPELSKCTLKIICETAMGVDLKDITNAPLDHIKAIHEIMEIATWRYWRPHIKDSIFNFLPQGRRYSKALNDLLRFGSKVVAHKNELRRVAKLQLEDTQNNDDVAKEKKHSFLDLIMDATEDQQDMTSDSDLKYLVNTFLSAGSETTASTAGWTLFLLGNHPEIQEKLFQEVRGVLGDKDAPSTLSDLNEMKYLECVIKETLRLYPVLPFLARRVTEDINIDGYTVPAGTQAFVHIFLVQRNQEYYPEPNTFDPERFTSENSKNRHPFAYIPFSAGPRNCIGMRFALLELKTIIATIIRRYKVTSLKQEGEVKLFAHVVLKSQTGIEVNLEKRN